MTQLFVHPPLRDRSHLQRTESFIRFLFWAINVVKFFDTTFLFYEFVINSKPWGFPTFTHAGRFCVSRCMRGIS